MNIVEALSGGDRRSIGRSNEVAAYALAHRSAVPELVAALEHQDAVVRMRAADALEKLSVRKAEWLTPHAGAILAAAGRRQDQEICWHAAQVLPRLDLDAAQHGMSVTLLRDLLAHRSRIVRASALAGLVDLSQRDPALRDQAAALVRKASMSGIPSLEARARKLLRRLGKNA
jgi:tagatose-1,6-bisphosphate aldolase